MAAYNVNFLIVLAKAKFCLFTMAKLAHSEDTYQSIKNTTEFDLFNKNLKLLLAKFQKSEILM